MPPESRRACQLTPLPDPLAAAAAQAGLNEDETAIACFLEQDAGLSCRRGEVIPLADALQDAYLALLMERALAARSAGGKHPAARGIQKNDKKGSQEHLSKQT